MKTKIYISGDHAGFEYKEKLKNWLNSQKYPVEDLGPKTYDSKDDYPDYTFPLAEKVSKNKNSKGIVIAGSGIGEVIAANKVKNIRAVLFHSSNNLKKFLETSRIHDDTNVLCFGSRFVTLDQAKKGIKIWLNTKFKNETRHKRRLGKISKYEKQNFKK
jgi:ribose 5-phosphate isomerase B